MKIEVDSEPWCEGCENLTIEENSMYIERHRVTFRKCEHLPICRNAVNQFKKIGDEESDR